MYLLMNKRISSFLKPRLSFIIFFAISFAIFLFYLIYINLSTDTIILFLSSKLFYGEWLKKGIFPFFNPYIFNGIPYAFDLGMNHFHPFSYLFILPFPLSFAAWSAITCLLFLVGFYLLFSLFTNKKWFAISLTFILFFSGSGFFLRMNNPTILSVISHYGLFLFSLYYLRKPGWKNYIFPLVTGVFLTLSGHIQFVLYGYIIGFIVSVYYHKISLKKIFLYFLFLALLTSWYYLLSLPLVFESTRLILRKDYVDTGPIMPLQFLQLLFPFLWGYVENGSKWNVGPTNVLLSSLLVVILFIWGCLKRKIDRTSVMLVGIFLLFSIGLVNFPFFRGPGQIFILIHIIILIALAKNNISPDYIFKSVKKKYLFLFVITIFIIAAFFISPIFSSLFLKFYLILKHGKGSLFYDKATIAVIGMLIGYSFVPTVLLLLTIFISNTYKKTAPAIFIIFIIIEGSFVNTLHNYFAPSNIFVTKKNNLNVNLTNYRMQTSSDVVPYEGFHNYMGNILFRSPFSKEPPYITTSEEKTFNKLRKIFTTIPSSWSMVDKVQAVQGYSTFVPANIAYYFNTPSDDYKQVYDYIIQRNSYFAQSEKGSHINSIESSRITLNDPRWEKLGVRYFISDRPLKKYSLIEEKNGRYIYEDENTLPIYRIVNAGQVSAAIPYYNDPNQWKFAITKTDAGKEFQMVMNPGGFIAKLNGKEIPINKETFLLRIPLNSDGNLVVYYSPIKHLQETLTRALKLKK